MIIHSKDKDYYDVCQSYGADKTLRYVREEKKISHIPTALEGLPIGSVFYRSAKDIKACDYKTEAVWVGFCGKLYFGFAYDSWVCSKKDYTWGEDAITEIIADDSKFRSTFRYLQGGVNDKSPWGLGTKLRNIREVMAKDFTNVFVELDAPIFLYRHDRKMGGGWKPSLTINPNLHKLDFVCVKDPYTAYQELSMFLGNELAKQVDPEPLSDKGRLLAHGMDPVWSFRNPEPPKRKRK